MVPHQQENPVFTYDLADERQALLSTKALREIPEKANGRLLTATWNLTNFGLPKRTDDDLALKGGAVLIAGSGMCTGGRVRHHLKHNLWRQNCSVVFVGFASRGTLARRIVDGARQVRIFGEDIQVRAHIHTIGGFSAHADQDELLAWHEQLGHPARTFLVHGEEDAMSTFAEQLSDTEVLMPQLNDEFDL